MTPLLQGAGWALMHFVWQGAAIALLATVALRLAARRSANVRYVISCGALAVMLAAPAVTVRLLWQPDGTAMNRTRAAIVSDGSRPENASTAATLEPLQPAAAASASDTRDRRWQFSLAQLDRFAPGVAVAWLAGVAVLLGRMAGGWWRVRRLHRAALATPSSRWQTACRRLAYRLGLPAAAHVVESAMVDVPTVVGWLRPAILLPVAALALLTPSQIEAIIAHELAHIRRHDYAVNLLQTIAETLLFYHPAVWWVSNRIRVEREHCCDEVAVAVCGDPVGYAQALAELESSRTMAATMAMAATGGSLSQRVRRILQLPLSEEPRSPSWPVTLALTLLFTAGAGSVQHLPWPSSRADARAVSTAGAAADQTRPVPPVAPEPPEPPAPPMPPALPVIFDPALPQPPQPAPPPPPVWDASGPFIAPPLPPVPPAPPVPPVPPVAPVQDVPPAPPAPPVPPAPPAPREPSSSFSSSSRRNEWRMRFSDNGGTFDVTLRGTIEFTDDLTDVQSLSDGGSFTIRDWSRVIPRTVEIKSEGGKLTRAYFVGGMARPWDEEARTFLATQLPVLVRRSGFGAESRVKAIFDKKGVNGVLEEIDLLGGDYARRLYLVALVDRARFDANGVKPVLARVGQRMTADYDRRQVLEHVASHVSLDTAGASAYIQAMSTMKSDYDQRQALGALVKSAGNRVDANAMAAAVGHINSSYDKRMVLADVIGRGSLSADSKRSVLAAAAGMQSDYDRGQVLTAYVQSYGVEPGLREPFFAAVRAIKSDYERRRVLTDVAKKDGGNREIQQAAFDVVSQMSSDYDRAEILLAFIAAQGIDSASRPAFVSAAERLKSAHDQNRVLAALVRSERSK
jgi:beta-lactamase regulating signal transducer with metallopeptidase domain